MRTTATTILLALTISLAVPACCPRPAASLYPAFDILKPNEAVRKNPIEVTAAGTLVINYEFWYWVVELQDEIKFLRDALAREQRKNR